MARRTKEIDFANYKVSVDAQSKLTLADWFVILVAAVIPVGAIALLAIHFKNRVQIEKKNGIRS